LSVDGSAGLEGIYDVPRPKGFEDVPALALKVLLGVGKQNHENQSCYDTSGYDVLHHGCHSAVVSAHHHSTTAIDARLCAYGLAHGWRASKTKSPGGEPGP
jgi:hypothetical protein